jgi:hypothetical protein
MQRTLIGRGLAVVSTVVAVAGLAAGPAGASGREHGRQENDGHRHLVVTGGFTDPGPAIDTVTPDGSDYIVTMHGSTTTTGGLAGTSTYQMAVRYDPVTFATTGTATETFAATLANRGSGHVSLAETVNVRTDGSETVVANITGGDGVFGHARGRMVFTGQTDPSGSNPSVGTYRLWIDLGR